MAGILAADKIRLCMLCFSAFLLYAFPSFGASPQQLPEAVVVSPESKSPAVTTPVKGESPRLNNEGIKQSHSEPANGKLPPKPKDSMRKHKNPIDISTGKEILPMPVEPKR